MSRFVFALSTVLVFIVPNASAQMLEDVLYLQDGSVIRGTLIEQIPNKSIKIKTRDGSIFSYAMEQVIKITKEPVVSMPTIKVKEKSPAVACVLSLLVVGTGQAYNEDYGKAAIHWFIALCSITMIVIGIEDNYEGWYGQIDPDGDDDTAVVGYVFGVSNLLLSVIEAPYGAKRYNERLSEHNQLSIAPIKRDDGLGAKFAFRF